MNQPAQAVTQQAHTRNLLIVPYLPVSETQKSTALPTLTMENAIAILHQVPLIKEVSPNIDDPIQAIYGNQNWYTTYRGVSPDLSSIQRWWIDR